MGANVVDVGNGQVELHTTRLRLRGAVQGDVEPLNKAFTDSEVMRYWYVLAASVHGSGDNLTKDRSEPPHRDLNRTREWVSSMISNEQNGEVSPTDCSQQPLVHADSPSNGCPTKVLAVARRLQEDIPHCKR